MEVIGERLVLVGGAMNANWGLPHTADSFAWSLNLENPEGEWKKRKAAHGPKLHQAASCVVGDALYVFGGDFGNKRNNGLWKLSNNNKWKQLK